jgi:hypothetical protein
MADFTRANTGMIRRKAMGFSNGQMAEPMKVNGKMGSKMVLDCTHQHQANKREGSGLKGKELDGYDYYEY